MEPFRRRRKGQLQQSVMSDQGEVAGGRQSQEERFREERLGVEGPAGEGRGTRAQADEGRKTCGRVRSLELPFSSYLREETKRKGPDPRKLEIVLETQFLKKCFGYDALEMHASQFEQSAGKLKNKFWLQNMKMLIALAVVFAILIAFIVYQFV